MHPKVGASWEGYVIEEAIRSLEPDEEYFWATHNGAEIDLVLMKNGRRYGIECKRTDAPKLTPSMRAAIHELKLDRLCVIYPQSTRYELSPRISVVPLKSVAEGIKGLFYEH